MVNCNNCAFQNFCYEGYKDYCLSYIPAMITYEDKISNTNVTYYSIVNSAK